jgi:peptidoglycan/xylan/chitin deacetylase (PgdA/CDA1 family)
MSTADLRAVLAAGHDVQSHTRTHPNLADLSDRSVLDELEGSRRELEQVTGKCVNVIAYPWGSADARVQRIAADAGYAAGVILRRRVNFPTTSTLELRRIGINSETTIARFAWDLARLRFRGD